METLVDPLNCNYTYSPFARGQRAHLPTRHRFLLTTDTRRLSVQQLRPPLHYSDEPSGSIGRLSHLEGKEQERKEESVLQRRLLV